MAARQAPPSTIAQVRDVFPKLGEISDKVLFGDVLFHQLRLSMRHNRQCACVPGLSSGRMNKIVGRHAARAD